MSESNKKQIEETNVQGKHFYCYRCGQYWFDTDYIEKDEDFLAKCPSCKALTKNVGHYYANLEKMKANATGPKTAEGKKRSSLNNFKTGMSCKKYHMLAPALHGKFAQCKNCEDAKACENKELKYCPVNTTLLLRFIKAYEEGDVNDIKQMAGLVQGQAFLVLQNALSSVFTNGIDKSSAMVGHIKNMMEVTGTTADQQKMTPRSEEGEAPGTTALTREDVSGFIGGISDFLRNIPAKAKEAEKTRSKDLVLDNIEREETGQEADLKLPDHNIFKK